jgi:hypothetical protein
MRYNAFRPPINGDAAPAGQAQAAMVKIPMKHCRA